MTAYPVLQRTLWKSRLREPVGLFFTLVFAPVLVLILGVIFGNDPKPEFGGHGYMESTLPAFTSLVLAITGVMQVPVALLTLRESGALRRLRLTPMRPADLIAADLTVNFVIGLAGMVLAVAVGVLAFGVALPSSLPAVLAASALGLCAFLALGYLLACLYPSVAGATAIGNVLMIILMVTSGAFAPISVMPEGVRRVVAFSPVRQFVVLVQGAWDGRPIGELTTPLLVMVGMLVVCTVLARLLFRWERA